MSRTSRSGCCAPSLPGTGDLAERPAALEEAREAAERAAHQDRIAAQLAGRAEAQRARAVGRAALGGAGHAAARAIAAEVARRAAHNRGGAGRRGPDAGARCRVARGGGHGAGVAAGSAGGAPVSGDGQVVGHAHRPGGIRHQVGDVGVGGLPGPCDVAARPLRGWRGRDPPPTVVAVSSVELKRHSAVTSYPPPTTPV